MILAQIDAFGLTLAEVGVLAVVVLFGLEVVGLSRSSRTLRPENADLRERVATLEGELLLAAEKADKEAEKAEYLRIENAKLQERNVDALWAAFRDHDERMSLAAMGLTDALSRIAEEMNVHEDRAQKRHAATLDVLTKMAIKLA